MTESATPETTPNATGAEVRAWAQENGHDVKDKGRLSGAVKTAFTEATGRPAS